jgi:hypothetical protein
MLSLWDKMEKLTMIITLSRFHYISVLDLKMIKKFELVQSFNFFCFKDGVNKFRRSKADSSVLPNPRTLSNRVRIIFIFFK